MPDALPHPWPTTPREAIALQESLRGRVIERNTLGDVRLVAGTDVGFEDGGQTTRAAVVLLSFPDLALVASRIARRPTSFPYVPGLLAFRELPAVLEALGSLDDQPDLLLCDGHGRIHPRRFGLACHMGVATGIPTIGVGKSHYLGQYEPPGPNRGDWNPVIDRGEVVGATVRTRLNVRPIYVSVGHGVDLASAVAYTLRCVTRYRLPEPTRLAHQHASRLV
ncbi:MAG: deoxyribonuclease V [Candidatus Promineofilum sp.]|nr:deoxyribonuclease V [Promineifilum sp.]